MKLIDKDALVAEIERWTKLLLNEKNQEGASRIDKLSLGGRIAELQEIKAFLSTIEVKEVDLENSVKGIIDYPLIGVDFPNVYPNYKELKDYCDKNGIKDKDEVKIVLIKEE